MRYLLMPLCALLCLQAQAQDISDAGASTFPASTRYEVAFAPEGGALELVLKAINSARHEILVATYTFSNTSIAQALLAAKQRGVAVRVVSDRGTNLKYTQAHFLASKGLPVRLNGQYRIHHHKFMVIDGNSVETGSFNYAKTAIRNAENVLLIWHAPELAKAYAAEWEKMWEGGEDIKAAQ